MDGDEVTTPQETAGDPAATTESAPPPPQTPEQIAESARISGLQRAHNAETATLRAQIADYEGQLASRRQAEATASAAEMTEAQRAQQRADALAQELATERAARVIDQRRLKYPEAAAELPDKAFAAMDEGDLAGYTETIKNRRGDAGGQVLSYVDPNRPPKQPPATAKPITEKSPEELKADLARLGPAFAQELQQGG